MRPSLILSAIALCLLSTAVAAHAAEAQPERYVLAGVYAEGEGETPGAVFLDPDSRERRGDLATVRTLAVPDKPAPIGAWRMDHIVVVMEVDCARRTGRIMSARIYGQDGGLLGAGSRPDRPSLAAHDADRRAYDLACGAAVGDSRAFASRAAAIAWARSR